MKSKMWHLQRSTPRITHRKADAAHVKEVIESMQSNDNSDESSTESNADEENIKIEADESKPSISQETIKI